MTAFRFHDPAKKNEKMEKRLKTEQRDKEVERQIDDNLKRAFNQVAEEPIPDRLMDLLNQLRKTGDQDPNGTGENNV